MDTQTTLWYRSPAMDFDHALPVGNGRIGGMLFGDPEREVIQLNEDSVWSGGKRERNNPDAYEGLQEIRKLLLEEHIGEAEKMVIKQLLFKGLLLIILGVLCVTQYGVLLAALPFVTWVYAIAMLILAAYKVQCTVDILRLSGIRWYFPAISAALAVVLALFILLNPNTAMNIVWGFMGVSIILEAGLEIATIILLK